MESIKDYAEQGFQKDLIVDILRQIVPDVSVAEYEELTEMVAYKIQFMTEYRTSLASSTEVKLAETAAKLGVTEDHVLDTFIHFSLIVENVWLAKQLLDVGELNGDG